MLFHWKYCELDFQFLSTSDSAYSSIRHLMTGNGTLQPWWPILHVNILILTKETWSVWETLSVSSIFSIQLYLTNLVVVGCSFGYYSLSIDLDPCNGITQVTNFELFYSVANDQVWAAHLCYTLAGEKFGFPSDEKTKMALIGIDHR